MAKKKVAPIISGFVGRWESLFELTKSERGWNSYVREFEMTGWLDWETILHTASNSERYKARALMALLVPRLDVCPFEVGSQPSLSMLLTKKFPSFGKSHGPGVSDLLLQFSIDLVCSCVEFIKGQSTFVDGDPILDAYNEEIIGLLRYVKVGSEEAQRLWKCFSIKSRVWSSQTRTEYTPYITLLERAPGGIHLHWADAAEKLMRAEVANNQPTALWGYTSGLRAWMRQNDKIAQVPLFFSQIEFLLTLIHHEHVYKQFVDLTPVILSCLSKSNSEIEKQLGHRICTLVFLDSRLPARVVNNEAMEGAFKIAWHHFVGDDHRLSLFLTEKLTQIHDRDLRAKSEEVKKSRRREKLKRILYK